MCRRTGLSRSDRTSPRDVVRSFDELAATRRPSARSPSRAAAGRSDSDGGTLAITAAGPNTARCATSALAGYCTTTGGRQVAFAFLMNYVSPWSARVLQDRMAIALTKYSP